METIELNAYQTPIEDLHLEKLPKEIQDQFWDFFWNIPLIQNMVSKDRPRAKDLPKDNEGKIIIDVTKPHILEDMEYFMPAAKHYKETGKYTDLRPNPNPNSEYGKWAREEVRRCLDGYVRPSDGEWIPGTLYYFWNYSVMSVAKKTNKGDKKALRVIDFPNVWEGHYLKFHYLNQAREKGKHGIELSRRGSGKSYTSAAMLARHFILGERKSFDEEEQRRRNRKNVCYAAASDKKYLVAGDQTLDKFQFDIDFAAENTEWPRKRLINTIKDMQWTLGYQDLDSGTKKGLLNSVVGVSMKDDESRLRGTRGVLYIFEEAGSFSRLLEVWNNQLPSVEDGENVFGQLFAFGCCCAGTKVWNANGELKNIEELNKNEGIVSWDGKTTAPDIIKQQLNLGQKPCIKIVTTAGRTLECSTDHPLYKGILHTHRIAGTNKRSRKYEWKFVQASSLIPGDKVGIARCINAWGTDTLFDPYLVGVLIGDGSYGYNQTPRFSNEDNELLDYVKSNYNWSYVRGHITKKGKSYEEIRIKNICNNLKEIGIYGQVKDHKRLPDNFNSLTKEHTLQLLAGIIDTDGCVYYKDKVASYISIVQCNKIILQQIQILLRKLGVTSHICEVAPTTTSNRKDKNPWYVLGIKGLSNIRCLKNLPLKHITKKKNLELILSIPYNNYNYGYDTGNIIMDTIKSVEYIGIQTIYNMEVTNNHTYIANDFITHNTAGDSNSDFSAMQEMMYHPEGYHAYGVENVYDISGKGGKTFTFFFPGYINRANCYDENGNSDVTKALLEILRDRYQMKYNSTDLNAVSKRTAEIPITPQEAIIRSRGNMFPIAEINERIVQLDADPNSFDDVYIGRLIQKPDGKVEFEPTNDTPIREYPLKDNKAHGALEIYKLPEKNSEGLIINNRYIIGHDPVDYDQSDSMSLSSTFVLDLFTDKIVAEYTGRQDYAEENYEIVRRLCLFYNAKCLYENNLKGLYAYFSKMRSTYLLADTPEYLRDKDLIKGIGIGNGSKGVNATKPVNDYANKLIRDWLISPKTIVEKDDSGEEHETQVLSLSFLKNRALLKELSCYNHENNFDRVRSLGMLMLYREQFMIQYEGKPKETEWDKDYFANDEFFTKNYDKKVRKDYNILTTKELDLY